MAGEIQIDGVTLATQSGGAINFGSDVTLPYALQGEVFGTHTTGTITSGTNSLTVASGAGISNGDYITGEGIAPGTTVSSGGGTTSITLSANAAATLSSDPVSFYKSNKVLSPGLVAGALCRAWVNIDGLSGGSIRASYNVSSVTGFGTGKYTINFITGMPDNSYAVATTAQRNYATDGDTDNLSASINMSTSNNQLQTSSVSVIVAYTSIKALAAPLVLTVAIFR